MNHYSCHQRFAVSEAPANWYELVVPSELCGHPVAVLTNRWTRATARIHVHGVPKSGPPTDGDNFVRTYPICKSLSLLENGVNSKQNHDIFHHTQSMLPHYLSKIKVQISDKLQTSCLMKRNIFRYTVRQTTLLLVTFTTAVRNVCLLPVHTVVDAYATCQLHFNRL